MKPFANAEVAKVFEAYPADVRRRLLALRELILQTASSTEGVGKLEETLKWGEPAYLTFKSKSGSTIRMDRKKARPTECAMYFNCKTTLVETFKTLFPREFKFEGNRAIVFKASEAVPTDSVAFCVAAGPTYHRSHEGKHHGCESKHAL